MNKWPAATESELLKFYGDPDVNDDGMPDVKFEAKNLTKIVPPYPMFWTWNMRPVSSIRIHKKCADSLMRCLTKIGELPPATIEKYHLNRCGGGYNFRSIRGQGNRLSMHAYGCAIDIADDLNPLGKRPDPLRLTMPKVVVDIFAEEGWDWGGLWKRPDGMHFQAAKEGLRI